MSARSVTQNLCLPGRRALEFFVGNCFILLNVNDSHRNFCSPRAAGTGPPHNIRHFDSANLAIILEIGPHLKSTENRLLFDVPAQKQTCLDIEKEFFTRSLG
jgi:hypothetical protein